MISKDKQYRTRDGREVRIYATDGAGLYSIHGAMASQSSNKNKQSIVSSTGWFLEAWFSDGQHYEGNNDFDLIEVKPRIRRTVWLNVYDDKYVGLYYNRKNADEDMEYMPSSFKRVACVKVEIDCEEGEGL